MPMDFPSMASLIDAARVHRFRAPEPNETEGNYRAQLAAHVQKCGDIIEAHEIRTSRGHDKWTTADGIALMANNIGMK